MNAETRYIELNIFQKLFPKASKHWLADDQLQNVVGSYAKDFVPPSDWTELVLVPLGWASSVILLLLIKNSDAVANAGPTRVS